MVKTGYLEYEYMSNVNGERMPLSTFRTVTEIRGDLEKPFPSQAIRQRKGGGGRSFDYVGHDTVTRRLIEATGGVFNWTVTHQEYRTDGGLTTHIVTGILEIPGLGARAGTGVQAIRDGSGEDQYKGAESDAIKRAAMRFGVAMDLYGEDVEGQLAQAETVRAASTLAAARVLPTSQPERMAALKVEMDRIGGDKIREYCVEKFSKVKRSDLTFDELGDLLEWSYGQE